MILIRRATRSDTAALIALVHGSRAYDGYYRAILDGYQLTHAKIERDHIYVAEMDAHLVGFYSLIADGIEPELDLLFVSDEIQGCGVGSALLAHLKTIAASLGIEAIRIVSHPPALGFYLNIGAQQEGVVPPRGRVSWERPLLRLRVSTA